jgi:ribulose-5-phosphate 4-epimerase/fuculose-1-phosphate aldolase
MATKEGVIKFEMEYKVAPALPEEQLRELNAWRKLMYLTELIGQTPTRYGGYGFGNISCRVDYPCDSGQPPFAITGTQTGGAADLTPDDYVVVTACYPESNRLAAEGPVKPSSESLTHGVIYALDNNIRWVMHAHSPHIWRNAAALALPMTAADVAYGTPDMAAEVARLFRESDVAQQRIFGMAGHEDGIVSFGATAEEAGFVLLGYLARAFQFPSEP